MNFTSEREIVARTKKTVTDSFSVDLGPLGESYWSQRVAVRIQEASGWLSSRSVLFKPKLGESIAVQLDPDPAGLPRLEIAAGKATVFKCGRREPHEFLNAMFIEIAKHATEKVGAPRLAMELEDDESFLSVLNPEMADPDEGLDPLLAEFNKGLRARKNAKPADDDDSFLAPVVREMNASLRARC
jgi:hypothetical protein